MTGALQEGPEGWLLDPSGAVLRPEAGVAVLADVHLGYEWAREANGDCVPEHSLAETIKKLEGMLARSPVALTRLIVAGDLVESRRPCLPTSRAVAELTRWVSGQGLALVALKGNHDPPRRGALTTIEVEGWTIAHGDRPLPASRTISGHLHPRLRSGGVNAPCFVVGPRSILLPAFSPNAAGVHLAALGLLSRPDAKALRCVASADGLLLDFGPLPELLNALRD